MSVEVELEKGEVTRYRRHENGRGLVSPSAQVNPSAYVSSAAYVESDAQVGPESWIGQGSWIDHGAIIGARVFVGANVHVGADAIVGNEARLASNTHVGRGAFIADGAVIDHEIAVPDFTDVHARTTAVRARTALPGGTIVGTRPRPRRMAAHLGCSAQAVGSPAGSSGDGHGVLRHGVLREGSRQADRDPLPDLP